MGRHLCGGLCLAWLVLLLDKWRSVDLPSGKFPVILPSCLLCTNLPANLFGPACRSQGSLPSLSPRLFGNLLCMAKVYSHSGHAQDFTVFLSPRSPGILKDLQNLSAVMLAVNKLIAFKVRI